MKRTELFSNEVRRLVEDAGFRFTPSLSGEGQPWFGKIEAPDGGVQMIVFNRVEQIGIGDKLLEMARQRVRIALAELGSTYE